MDGISQEQLPPQEPKGNALLQGVEFGMGGILLGVGTFLLMLFVLNYFNIVSLSLVFPNQLGWLPHRTSPNPPPSKIFNPEQSRRTPSPTPTQKTVFPIPITHPLVQGVSIYYRLSGIVEEMQTQENGDLSIKLISSDGIIYPQSFALSSTQTIVSKKGKGLGGMSLSDIKEGDKLELVYTVDLKTNQSLVNQVQLIKSSE